MYLTALDIGTFEIKALVAQIKRDGHLFLVDFFRADSSGVRKGETVSVDDLSAVLKSLFAEIKKMHRGALKNIFVNVGGGNVKFRTSSGIVAVSRADNGIYAEDVDRVIKASQALNIGSNRMVIHTLTREFIVDGVRGITDPLGMLGSRLEVETLIIDAFRNSVNNLVKAIEAAGGKTAGLIYGPLASAHSVLGKKQKDLGVVAVDLGAGTTSIAVYEENNLLHASVLGVGSRHITNDLAIGLRSSIETAEKIKLRFGFALSREVSPREKLELQDIFEEIKSPVARRFIAEIIEIRLAEIFQLVNSELKSIGKNGRLPAGAVLTGGGSKMPGIVDLAKKELKLPVQIGIPEILSLEASDIERKAQLEDPEFGVAAGLLLWGMEELSREREWFDVKDWRLVKFLKYFLP